MTMTAKKKIVIIVVVLFFLGIFFIATQSGSRTGFDIDTSPQDAVVTINNKTYSAGFIALKPGNYVVDVTHDAFKPQQRTVTVTISSNEKMVVILSPDGENGEIWLNNHPKEVARRESIGSKVIGDLATQQTVDLPILKQLPHVDNFYRVDYGVSKKYPKDLTKTALYVRYYSLEGLADAKDWLVFNDVDIEKTEIIYIDAALEKE